MFRLMGKIWNLESGKFSTPKTTTFCSSWDLLVNSIPLTALSTEVTGRILLEEARRAECAASAVMSTALIAKGTSSTKPKQKSKFCKGVFCQNCNKEGHIKAECRSAKAQTSGLSFNAHMVELDSKTDSYAFTLSGRSSTPVVQGEIWPGDTAAQNHIVRDCSAFTTYTETPGSTISDVGSACAALGCGDVCVTFITKARTVPVTLKGVLHTLTMQYNQLSLGRLSSRGITFIGEGDELHLKDGARAIGFGCKAGDQLYHMNIQTHPPKLSSESLALAVCTTRTWYEWHCALGYIN